jgi:dynein heavy chain 2
LVEAYDTLSIRPQTVEEIGEVNAKHAELSKRKPEIEPLFAEAKRKNKLLQSVAGGGVEPMVASSQHLAYNMVILTTVM